MKFSKWFYGLILSCLVLALAGPASAAVDTTGWYGTFVGGGMTFTLGSAPGVDLDQVGVDGDGMYIGIPSPATMWDTSWNDWEGDANYFFGLADNAQSFSWLNSNVQFTATQLGTIVGWDWSTEADAQSNLTNLINNYGLRWGSVVNFAFASDFNSFLASGREYDDEDGASVIPETTFNRAATPIPGAVWLLGSGLVGLMGVRRRMKK